MCDSDNESEYKDIDFINALNESLSDMILNNENKFSDIDFINTLNESLSDMILNNENEFSDIDFINTLDQSVIEPDSIRPADSVYREVLLEDTNENNNIDQEINDEYFDPEMIEAMNKSSEFYQNEFDENIFQNEIEKAIIESQALENERVEVIKKDRNQRLNHVIQQHIRYAPIDAIIFENIRDSFKLFLDMETDSILLDSTTYSIFVEYINSKKHRINSNTVTYILENIEILTE